MAESLNAPEFQVAFTAFGHQPCRMIRVLRPMAATTAALTVLTALGAAPARADAKKPAAAPDFGVQFHGTWGSYTDASRAQVLDVLKDNGVTDVRIDISWAQLQPDGPEHFSAWGVNNADKPIQMAARRGLEPMLTLWLAPQWATGSSDKRAPVTSPEGLRGLTSISEWLARKYRGVVSGFEVWNEPNDDSFMTGADPGVYAEMLQAAYAGFKAGDPGATVVFGGTNQVDDAWVTEALAAGAAGHYDVMSVHPYQAKADEPPETPDRDNNKWRMTHLPALKAAMGAVGDGRKPIWFTEFGWRAGTNTSTTPNWLRAVSEETQADYLARTLALIQSDWPYVEKVFWYRDRDTGSGSHLDRYGLIFPDGSYRPALERVGTLYSSDR
jgi:hypothetical protein